MLIGYARVSTSEQNPDLQIDALRAKGCEKVFTETASGAQRERPKLLALLEYARAGDIIVVWKLDRLARSMKQLIETIEGLEVRQIGFMSLTENIDTTTSSGKLIFNIFASLAEFERDIIKERTKAGLRAAKARGKIGGRPKALNDEDIKIARALLENPEISVKDIAKRLKISVPTLYRYFPRAKSFD